jgi:hypothetical protein
LYILIAQGQDGGLYYYGFHEHSRLQVHYLVLTYDPTFAVLFGILVNIEVVILRKVIFACVNKIIEIAGIVEVIEGITIGKADEVAAFKNFCIAHSTMIEYQMYENSKGCQLAAFVL